MCKNINKVIQENRDANDYGLLLRRIQVRVPKRKEVKMESGFGLRYYVSKSQNRLLSKHLQEDHVCISESPYWLTASAGFDLAQV